MTKPVNSEIIGCLESLPIFGDLSGAEIKLLAPLCVIVDGSVGHFILREGEPVHTIYFLLSGAAVVRKDGMLIATVGKGAVLGEMSLLQPGYKPKDGTALAIDQMAFNKLMEEHARLGYKVLKRIARLLALRLMMTDAKLAECLSIPHHYR